MSRHIKVTTDGSRQGTSVRWSDGDLIEGMCCTGVEWTMKPGTSWADVVLHLRHVELHVVPRTDDE